MLTSSSASWRSYEEEKLDDDAKLFGAPIFLVKDFGDSRMPFAVSHIGIFGFAPQAQRGGEAYDAEEAKLPRKWLSLARE